MAVGILAAFTYLKAAHDNTKEEDQSNPAKWAWNPFDWSGENTTIIVGVQGDSDGNITGFAGLTNPSTGGGFVAGYNTDHGWGAGSTDGSGSMNIFYPSINYNAAEKNTAKGISNMYRSKDPRFYHGNLNEAKELLIASSKYHNAEMSMYYFKDYGYYFEKQYGYERIPWWEDRNFPDNRWTYITFDGYYKYYYGENSIEHCFAYSLYTPRNHLYVQNGLYGFQNIGRPDAYFHTHRNNHYLGSADIRNMKKRGFPSWAVGWDGIIRGINYLFNLLPGVEVSP